MNLQKRVEGLVRGNRRKYSAEEVSHVTKVFLSDMRFLVTEELLQSKEDRELLSIYIMWESFAYKYKYLDNRKPALMKGFSMMMIDSGVPKVEHVLPSNVVELFG